MRIGIELEDEKRRQRLKNEEEYQRQRALEMKLLNNDKEIINQWFLAGTPLLFANQPMQNANLKLVKKIARLAHGISKKKGAINEVLDGKSLSSRSILLHAAALIVFKALNFKLPSVNIDEIFKALDVVAYIRIEDYYELSLDVLFSLEI